MQINEILEFLDVAVVGEIKHRREARHVDVVLSDVMTIRKI